MNKQQKNYALASAAYDAAIETCNEIEQKIIIREGIRNADGTIPTCVWTMSETSDAEFDRACELVTSDPEYKAAEQIKTVCRDTLAKSEDALIDYALSIVPLKIRDTLIAHKTEYSVRKKLLDAAFRLDTKTVPKVGIR